MSDDIKISGVCGECNQYLDQSARYAELEAALVEACKIAEDWIGDALAEVDRDRISAIRAIVMVSASRPSAPS